MRFIRALVHTSDCKFADTDVDWQILRRMSPHVSDAVKSFGIQRYDDALAMRNAVRKKAPKVRGGYSLSDLVIYICLLKPHKKKVRSLCWE